MVIGGDFGGGTNGLPDLGLEVTPTIEGVEFYVHQEQIEEVPERGFKG